MVRQRVHPTPDGRRLALTLTGGTLSIWGIQ